MALPTSMQQNLRSRAQSGIVIGFKPTTGKRYRIELKRSTQSSTASTNWTSIFLDPTSRGFTYRDELPLSTRTYYYRARQLGVGSSNSSYSLTVSAKPQRFPEVWKPLSLGHNNLGNVEVLGGDLWLSSAKTARVGQQLSTGLITKTIRFSGDSFIPLTNLSSTAVAQISRGIGTLTMVISTKSVGLNALYILPKGVTVTKYSGRGRQGTTKAKQVIKLYRISTAGVASSVATLTFTAAALQTITS